MKKTNELVIPICIGFFIIILVIGLTIFVNFMGNKDRINIEKKLTPECNSLCLENNYQYGNVTSKGIKGDICFCYINQTLKNTFLI